MSYTFDQLVLTESKINKLSSLGVFNPGHTAALDDVVVMTAELRQAARTLAPGQDETGIGQKAYAADRLVRMLFASTVVGDLYLQANEMAKTLNMTRHHLERLAGLEAGLAKRQENEGMHGNAEETRKQRESTLAMLEVTNKLLSEAGFNLLGERVDILKAA